MNENDLDPLDDPISKPLFTFRITAPDGSVWTKLGTHIVVHQPIGILFGNSESPTRINVWRSGTLVASYAGAYSIEMVEEPF